MYTIYINNTLPPALAVHEIYRDIFGPPMITLEFINNALLVHKGWLFLWNVKSRFQLLTDIHRLKYYANSCTKVIQLSTHDICGLLIFKRQDDSQNTVVGCYAIFVVPRQEDRRLGERDCR